VVGVVGVVGFGRFTVVGVVRLRGAGVVVVDAGLFAGFVAGLLERSVLPPIIPPPVTPLGSCWPTATLALASRNRIVERQSKRGRKGLSITFSPAALNEAPESARVIIVLKTVAWELRCFGDDPKLLGLSLRRSVISRY